MNIRVGIVAAIYAKTLRLPSCSTSHTHVTTGHITNLASNDVERFLHVCITLPFLLQGPFFAMIILVVGIYVVGPVFSVGYGLLILIILPLQLYLGRRFVYFRSKIASITDERVGLISQAIIGVRVMKMHVSVAMYVFLLFLMSIILSILFLDY